MADYSGSLSAPTLLHQKLRRIATFGTFGTQNEDDEDSLSFLPRLGRNSVASKEQNKVQWLHLREVVMETIENPKEPWWDKKSLYSLHEDICFILRSGAGGLVLDFLRNTLLPSALGNLCENMQHANKDLKSLLACLLTTWQNFIKFSLPSLEAIFINIKHSGMSIRQLCVDSFKEHVLIPLYDKLLEILKIIGQKEKRKLRSIFLIVKGLSSSFSSTETNLQLEKLITSVTTSYLGYHGLYENSSLVTINFLSTPHHYKNSDNFAIHSQQARNLCVSWNPTVETLDVGNHDMKQKCLF